MTETEAKAAAAIAVEQLSAEVRALRRLMLALLGLALVLLASFSLLAFFSIPKYKPVFDESWAGQPLPEMTRIALWCGDSLAVLSFLAVAPIASMAWLWLEQDRPAAPAFAMLCLCVLLGLFLIFFRISIVLPMFTDWGPLSIGV